MDDDSKWPEFLKVSEVAAILRVSSMTVYRMLHEGKLEYSRAGRSFRILAPSLRAYLAGPAVPPAPSAASHRGLGRARA